MAAFNPQDTIGPIYGTLDVIAEADHIVSLSFQGEIKPDIDPKTELQTTIKNITSNKTTITGEPLIFTTKSGLPFIPSTISINGEPFIGAHIVVNNNQLELTPYIHEQSLPNSQYGHTVLKVNFSYAIGTLTYDIPINWERTDPLCIINMGSGAYAISYTDNLPFKVRSLIVAPGLTYTTQFSDDGLTLFLKPKIKLFKQSKQGVVNGRQYKKLYSVKTNKKKIHTLKLQTKYNYKSHIKTKHQLKTHPSNNPRVLIQLETTHPYRSNVVIRNK
jgi:hypothetical protein